MRNASAFLVSGCTICTTLRLRWHHFSSWQGRWLAEPPRETHTILCQCPRLRSACAQSSCWLCGHIETCSSIRGAEEFLLKNFLQIIELGWGGGNRKTTTAPYPPLLSQPQYSKWLLSGRKSFSSKYIDSNRTKSSLVFVINSNISGRSPRQSLCSVSQKSYSQGELEEVKQKWRALTLHATLPREALPGGTV